MRIPLRRLRNADGIAAVEFALVAPVLILLLLGTVEFPRAYGISQGLEKAARTMADLISRGSLNSVDAVDSELGDPIPSEAKVGARYVTAMVTYRYVPVFGIFPGLDQLTFTKTVSWPVRGTGANSLAETVLPGGKACKAT
jgi:Flp pilus assembly protein TadG